MRILFAASFVAGVMISGIGSAQTPRRAPGNRPLANLREKIEVKADVEYAKAGDLSLQLDVYRPKQPADQPRPCIVWIHGGGWQNGNKSSGLNRLGKWVAEGDYVGASIGYRLTDKASWPAQIHDCKAAIRFLRKHAEEYGIDSERIGVWGSSAGGHLVSLLGTSGDVAELEGDLGVTGVSSRVRCVVDFCGPSDFIRFAQKAPRESAPGQPVYKLFGGPLQDRLEMAKQASPVTYVSKDDPPFLIVHGTEDKTVPLDQALTFHAAQEKAGMDTTLVEIEGGGHGIGGPEIDAKVKAFFDEHLK
ncbi:MAG: alpha/beta hydrolase fold domain-containing protein [Planctomycetaceae bacterium]